MNGGWPVFVITLLPPNQFKIGLESKLKEDLFSYTKNITSDMVNYEELYE